MISNLIQLNQIVAGICGLAFNIAVIWLIWRKTPREMKAYSKILIQTCCIDIFMILLNTIGGPIYIVFQGCPMIFVNGPFYLSHTMNCIVVRLWLFGYYFTMASSSIQFTYRYIVLCRRAKVTNLSHFLMLFVSAILSIACVYLAHQSTYLRDEDAPKALLFTEYWRDISGQADDGTIIDVSFRAVPTSTEWLTNCVFAICFEVLVYSVIAFCGYQTSKAMHMLAEIGNKRVIKINRQLNMVLLLQATLPLMAITVNATCLLISYNNRHTLSFIIYLFMPLHWQPLFTSLIPMLTVRSFKNFILRKKETSNPTIYNKNYSIYPMVTTQTNYRAPVHLEDIR